MRSLAQRGEGQPLTEGQPQQAFTHRGRRTALGPGKILWATPRRKERASHHPPAAPRACPAGAPFITSWDGDCCHLLVVVPGLPRAEAPRWLGPLPVHQGSRLPFPAAGRGGPRAGPHLSRLRTCGRRREEARGGAGRALRGEPCPGAGGVPGGGDVPG